MKRICLSFLMVSLVLSARGQLSLIATINPDSSSHAAWFTVFGSNLYFLANPDSMKVHLYKTNGTTTPVSVGLARNFIFPYKFVDEANFVMATCAGRMYFPGYADNLTLPNYQQLWSSDGSSAPVLNYSPTSVTGSPQYLVSTGGKVYFSSVYSPGVMMRYDPTSSLTSTVPGTANATTVQKLIVANNKVYYVAFNDVWYYDPAGDTTHRCTYTLTAPQELTAVDGALGAGGPTILFSASTTTYGRELYSYTEGQPDAVLVKDLRAGPIDGMPSTALITFSVRKIIRIMNGKVYFMGINNAAIGLFEYDPATTNMTLLTSTAASVDPNSMVVNQNKLYFFGGVIAAGQQLWRYDGTNPPAVVADVYPGSSNDVLTSLTVFNGDLYFAGSKAGHDQVYRYHDASTSVQQMGFDAAVSVYPNPASDALQVTLDLKQSATLSLQLRDLSARVVFKESSAFASGANQRSIVMQGFPGGVYVLSIHDSNGQVLYSTRVVKK